MKFFFWSNINNNIRIGGKHWTGAEKKLFRILSAIRPTRIIIKSTKRVLVLVKINKKKFYIFEIENEMNVDQWNCILDHVYQCSSGQEMNGHTHIHTLTPYLIRVCPMAIHWRWYVRSWAFRQQLPRIVLSKQT